jgi:hypothetical protein
MVVRLWGFGVPWSPGFLLSLPPRSGFGKMSKWPWNMIHLMPCRNPCRLSIHLASTYSVGSWSVVWSERRPAPLFPPVRFAWSAVVSCPQCRAWSGPKLNMNYLPLLKEKEFQIFLAMPFFWCWVDMPNAVEAWHTTLKNFNLLGSKNPS